MSWQILLSCFRVYLAYAQSNKSITLFIEDYSMSECVLAASQITVNSFVLCNTLWLIKEAKNELSVRMTCETSTVELRCYWACGCTFWFLEPGVFVLDVAGSPIASSS